MIEVKNISKKFNNNVVLNGIDLNINKGDVVAIIGPSGTGKSTFLRCLNRLEKPESGSISIGDLSVDLARSDKKSLVELRKKTSMVFQGFNLFSKKTALENVMEGLIIVKKMDKKKAEEIAREQLKNVGLLEWANHYPARSLPFFKLNKANPYISYCFDRFCGLVLLYYRYVIFVKYVLQFYLYIKSITFNIP